MSVSGQGGGSGKRIPADSAGFIPENFDGSHATDVAIAQAAFRHLGSRLRAQCAAFGHPEPVVTNLRRIAQFTCRCLSRGGTMSANMRRIMSSQIPPAELAKILTLHRNDAIPEVLRNLPKRPPMRKPVVDD